ncbi:MAG: hypothetical protein JKY56_11770, partial [Kofleriaceae bacterium]|nr:hypothetical protein [Kofleriaceae bacterium]
GRGSFCTSAWAAPDILTWWGGGHTGYIHTGARYRVAKPLAMVSTWDGDELSLVRDHFHLRAARGVDISGAILAWDKALEGIAGAGMKVRGTGLYRVIEAGARAEQLLEALSERGLQLRSFPGGKLAVIPCLDSAKEDAAAFGKALGEIL